MPTPFPSLQNLFEGYLHQDFLIDYASPYAAIVAFTTEESGETMSAVRHELQQALEILNQAPELNNEVLRSLGGYYDPSSDGLSVLEWFTQIQEIVSRRREETTQREAGGRKRGD